MYAREWKERGRAVALLRQGGRERKRQGCSKTHLARRWKAASKRGWCVNEGMCEGAHTRRGRERGEQNADGAVYIFNYI